MPSPFDSAGSVGLQPAAELGHLQRHDHVLHVLRARSARALGPQALSRAFSPCMPLVCRHHTPGPLASRLAPLPPHRMPSPSTGQEASAFNQPLSFDSSNVTDMRNMFYVRSARALGPQALSQAPCMPTLPPRTLSPASRHAHLAPHYIHAPLSTPAERKLLVRPQQAAHPLRVGGHRGLRLRWLWLGLGSGKLRVREARLESCSGSSSYLREPQQHPYRTLTVWSRLVSATAFVAFELYDARFFRALQSERVRCVDVLR